MQDKSLPAASLSRKPELRTLMPPTNKCSNMPTIVSAFVCFEFIIVSPASVQDNA